MEHLHKDLGLVEVGSVVVVELAGCEANVRLLDDGNLAQYRRGGRHRFYGGHYRASPVRIAVPATGRWHVAVDLGGRAGRVGAAVRVVPPR